MPGITGPRPAANIKIEHDFKTKEADLKAAKQKLQTAKTKVRDLQKKVDSYEDVGSKFSELDQLRTKMQDAKKKLDAPPGGKYEHETQGEFESRFQKQQDLERKMFGMTDLERDYKHAKESYDRVKTTFDDPSELKAKLADAKREYKEAKKEFVGATRRFEVSAKKYGTIVKQEGKQKADELMKKADRFTERAHEVKVPGQGKVEIETVTTRKRGFGQMHSTTESRQVIKPSTRRFQTDEMKAKMEEALKEKEELHDKAYDARERAQKMRIATSRWTHDQLKELKDLKKEMKD